MMKAVVAHEYGAPTLKFEEGIAPEPKDDSVCAQSQRINPADRSRSAVNTQGIRNAFGGGSWLRYRWRRRKPAQTSPNSKWATRFTVIQRRWRLIDYAIGQGMEVAAKPKSLNFVEAAAVDGRLTAWQALMDGEAATGPNHSDPRWPGVGSFAPNRQRVGARHQTPRPQTRPSQLGADVAVDWQRPGSKTLPKWTPCSIRSAKKRCPFGADTLWHCHVFSRAPDRAGSRNGVSRCGNLGSPDAADYGDCAPDDKGKSSP
jgi:hypothetical protein